MLYSLYIFFNLDAAPNVLAPGDDSLKFIKRVGIREKWEDRVPNDSSISVFCML